MAKFAENTSVAVDRSQSEIRSVLNRYGATQFMSGDDNITKRSVVQFVLRERQIRFTIQLPGREEKRFWFTPGRHTRRTEAAAYGEWEQACRTKWRALLLCIKAKLEAVDSGISLFEEEFLAQTVMPNGKTVAEMALPMVAEAYKLGELPPGIAGFLQ